MINQRFLRYFPGKGKKILALLLHSSFQENDYPDYPIGIEVGLIGNDFDICSYFYRDDSRIIGEHQVNNNFIELVEVYKPDIIFAHLQRTEIIKIDTLKFIKRKYPNIPITNLTGDAPYTAGVPLPTMVKVSPFMDATFINGSGKEIEAYEKQGCRNVFYLPHPYEEDKFYPLSDKDRVKLKKESKHKIVYCGTNHGTYDNSDSRVKMVKRLCETYGDLFKVYGGNWGFLGRNISMLPYYEQLYVYNAADIVINMDQINDIEGYFSDRHLIAMACKSLVVSDSGKFMKQYFKEGNGIVYFSDLNEMCNKIDFYLSNPKEIENATKSGYKFVNENYSYTAILKNHWYPTVEKVMKWK